jgi:UrcA family protein
VVNGGPARTVKYADLNLNSHAGAATLYGRIRHAAEQVCGDTGSRQLEQAAVAKACVDRAIRTSVHAVNRPTLTSEFNARSGMVQKPVNVASAR